MAEGRIIVDPLVMAGLIDAEQALEVRPKILQAMDPWTIGPLVADRGTETDSEESADAPFPAQGNLKEACAALRQGGICVDRGVFEALVCLAASGLLSSRP